MSSGPASQAAIKSAKSRTMGFARSLSKRSSKKSGAAMLMVDRVPTKDVEGTFQIALKAPGYALHDLKTPSSVSDCFFH